MKDMELNKTVSVLKELIDSFRTGPDFTGEVLDRIRREDGGRKTGIRGRVLRFVRSVAEEPLNRGRPGRLQPVALRKMAGDHGIDLNDPEVINEIRNISRPSDGKKSLSERELKAVAGGRSRFGELDRAAREITRLLEEPGKK